jgi:hypothetical protein
MNEFVWNSAFEFSQQCNMGIMPISHALFTVNK